MEDEWQYISGLKSKKEQSIRTTLSNAFADCYLFSNSGRAEFIFISPIAISPDFISYFQTLTNSHVHVLTPHMITPFISLNLILDKKVLKQLISFALPQGGIELYPYATSKQIYMLKKTLEKNNIFTSFPESPDEKNYWTVSAYGSKTGFRELVSEMNKKKDCPVKMPYGKVFNKKSQAIDFAAKIVLKQGKALLKIAKGSGGHGTFVLKRNDLGKNHTLIKLNIKKLLGDDLLWKKNRMVVEEYIKTDPNNPVQFPSIECRIDEHGINHILYHCAMLVSGAGSFYGMEVGREAVPSFIVRKMNAIARKVGDVYALNGYKGHFDIDMIYGKDGKLYVNESNVRNTGGTDAFKLCLHLLGKRLMQKSFILSKFVDFKTNTKLPNFNQILSFVKPILYSMKTKSGLIISSQASLYERSLTYFIIARSKKGAYKMEKKLLQIIQTSITK
ncbi:hypothetical protein A2334_03215 [Candidatus Roizmanbacteria bacterium RIFOXYB2_FULL_38_10]|uniref:ATP-grasp domain-containing protein n=1 Tax=Candidatus Roizmanbacteria bacterium RIFOXYD1_FULL_38_12 TaxID=1802093 RepID=A0A1F7L145_9BACT|nr:MAG: hypothetical protein A3K47_03635 [Candidatus Roizmanbacteria bacterium RIFOXYA2_FULL_38_14]OGK63854.1 MAG: hypothetical protein A3K27_03635 [Candidatus Roizmanbacteria bacterium RIFOXYA1_FULL_37_12]OGK65700.1 MAG: hypothetical protein A3K38_03635 [Candidatus Roizmanbacteria bacterium RIFOXYB1_FULL_40_23]OGK67414.1 MAG: hypothetical protein A2334_03215 [Candidatus Roizmanbacteria bacterium RIFOXYB2_FULL_38_10]OGK70105.1 MAG: hypothetical protein A3K21_03640 [Candidatus Roizmanbacteria ba